jgi:hypothetical protein
MSNNYSYYALALCKNIDIKKISFTCFSVPILYKQWDAFHGVSMESFAKQLRASKTNKPEIMNLNAEDILGSEEVALCWINLKEDTISDLDSYSIEHVVG